MASYNQMRNDLETQARQDVTNRFRATRYNNPDVRRQTVVDSNLANLASPSGSVSSWDDLVNGNRQQLTDAAREDVLARLQGRTPSTNPAMSAQDVQDTVNRYSTANTIVNGGMQGTGAWRSVFRPGNAVTSYADLQALAPGPYQSAYQPAMQATMNGLLNAQPFRYDVNADGLYQQIKDGYVKAGRQAMMDTMGRSAALTGGYGNSYGVTAGNQAYQESLGNLAGMIPELAQLAYSQYLQGQDDQRNNLEAMYKLENSEYQRWLADANAYQKALKDAPLDLSAAEASGMGGGGGAYFSGYGPTIITPNAGKSSSQKLNMDQWAAWQEMFASDPNMAAYTLAYLNNGGTFANNIDPYTGNLAANYWINNNPQVKPQGTGSQSQSIGKNNAASVTKYNASRTNTYTKK